VPAPGEGETECAAPFECAESTRLYRTLLPVHGLCKGWVARRASPTLTTSRAGKRLWTLTKAGLYERKSRPNSICNSHSCDLHERFFARL